MYLLYLSNCCIWTIGYGLFGPFFYCFCVSSLSPTYPYPISTSKPNRFQKYIDINLKKAMPRDHVFCLKMITRATEAWRIIIMYIIIIFPQPVLGAFVLSQSSPHQQREQHSNSHWYFYVNYVLFKATGFQRKLLIYSAPVQKDQISTNFFTQRSTTSLVFPPHPLGSDEKTSFF